MEMEAARNWPILCPVASVFSGWWSIMFGGYSTVHLVSLLGHTELSVCGISGWQLENHHKVNYLLISFLFLFVLLRANESRPLLCYSWGEDSPENSGCPIEGLALSVFSIFQMKSFLLCIPYPLPLILLKLIDPIKPLLWTFQLGV